MKQLFNKLVIASILLLPFIPLNSQPSEPGIPLAVSLNLPALDLPSILLPYVNNEDHFGNENCKSCGFKYGIDVVSSFDFWEHAQMLNISDLNIEVYRVRIKSPTAKGLQAIFSRLHLKETEKLYFYSPFNSDRYLGAYSLHNNKSDFSFVTNIIDSNELIIEINRSGLQPDKGEVKIQKFIHVLKNRGRFGLAQPCHTNAICPPTYNDLCNEVRSVVKFSWHRSISNEANPDTGWFLCSGSVVNSSNPGFDPLILTAHHCVDNGDQNHAWVVWFNFQSNVCNPSNNGNDLMTLAGIDAIASDHDALGCPDIAIMRIRESIPFQYNVFFSGWTRLNLSFPTTGIGIHHPRGDLKKVSIGDITNPLFTTCLKVDWTQGLTEGGSSGSPLFVSRLVVAVLSNGDNSNCSNTGVDFYSSIRKSWNTLQPVLSPGDEEVVAIFGSDPISACQPIINLNRRFFPGNDWQIKNQIIIQADQEVNVANTTETSIEKSPFNTPAFNSDYIIRAGNKITIFPRFKINAPARIPGTGAYNFTSFPQGNENRVSFRIQACSAFVDECGFNHQNSSPPPFEENLSKDSKFVSSTESIGFYIFPNPTDGTADLNIHSSEIIEEVIIFDLYGRKIIHKSVKENKRTELILPIGDFSKGLYLINIKLEGNKIKSKNLLIN
ncbi:MAG: T9SS type A sorting domain-containing protein [Bacteroidetes bacterium]|nr:T9SS type A sorting domain-containing protein [Bacteroidota bacterium]